MRDLAASAIVSLVGLIFKFQPDQCCPYCDWEDDEPDCP